MDEHTRMPDQATFMSVDNVQQAILYRKGRSMMGGAGGYAHGGLPALERSHRH